MKLMLALAATAILAGPAAAVEFVVNGGFEAPPTTVGGYVQVLGGNSFPGWSALGADVLILDTNYSESGLVFNAQSGQASIDLTGAGNTSPADGITQTLVNGAGNYRISFFVGNAAPDGGNGSNYTLPSTVRLSIDGGPTQSFTNGVNTPFGINWQKFSFAFSTPGATTITFTNGTGNDNFLGLDNVSVTPVPEASTWAMLVLGFGLIGVASRRRKVAIAA